jgi:two-component system sensor histidine kinase ChvG
MLGGLSTTLDSDDGEIEPVQRQRETRMALAGETGRAIRRHFGHRAELSVAVPVQRYKRVLGAVVLTRDSRSIDAAVLQIRLDILKVFGISLLITVGLSVYLAGTIARPLRRLALAADRVRRGLARQYAIPDFGSHDEIHELSGALREMTEALWTRMDAIEGFAADVAHEIKNPLTSLRSAIETASRISDPSQQQRLMAIVIDDIQRLDRLISDISNASRIDAELSRVEMVPVDLSALLDTLAALHEATIDSHGVHLACEKVGRQPLRVTGDEDRIVQVFRNLVDNAVSFSPPGSTIVLRAQRDGGAIKITVEDEGPGIPAGLEEAIFERFYRERPAGEKFGTHSGLGLSISRQIVEAHRGSLRAENRLTPGGEIQGARFIVRLPAAQ